TKPRNESVPENIDIAEYAIAETGKNVAFYAKVHGNLLAGDGSYIVETSTKNPVYFSTHRETAIPNGNGRDVAYVFVDTDNNQTTGFKPSVNFAVGADKAIEVVGKHGKIEISRILTFDGMNQEDWAWRVGESVPAATNGKELEIMCEKRSVEVKESYAIYLYMIDWNNTVSGVEQALRSENGKVTQFALYLSNSPPVKTEPEEMETKGTPHEPIHISGNNQFTQPNGVVGGSGTQEDPYIIEGWEIDGKGGKYCIFIENTTAYFVIRNCTVYNATADWWPPYGSGIALHNVSNGKVEKNRCNNSEYGIWVFNSSQNILITNNEVTSNRVGIHVDVSTNIIIIGNNVTNNRDDGISLAFNNCTITGNNVTNNNYGIWVTGGNHTVSENTVTNNEKGIYLEYANNCTITRNRVTHNSLDGIHIRDTENTTVMLNNASNNNRFGIFIDGGVYNQIGYNNVFSNSATGIMGYYHMRYTSITNNNVSSNSDGINITSYSTDNTITCNWVYYNTNYGLTLSYYSTNNTVLYNNFIGNNGAGRGIQGNCQACDKAGENSWYNSGTKRGNYWSNWDGTNWGTADAYPIDGGMASDWYPLPEPGFHPPIHIRSNDEFTPANGVSRGSGTPEDPYIIEGLIIDGAGGSYCIWIENTNLHFVIRNCQLQNATNSLWTPWGAGIALGNVTNGKIEGNICTPTRTGIICYGTSEFNLITENNVSQCRDGIYLSISNNNTITNNKAFNNTNSGIYLHSSANNTIRTNNVFSNSYGIYLSSSDNNTITNNEAFNNTNSGIYLYFSTNNTVGTNNVSGNYYGISLFSSAYNILSNNNVSHNLKYGFYFSSSNTNNRVAYNWIYNNTDYAIYLTYSSTGNIIHHNNIIANRGATKGVSGNCQAYDDVGGNYWYHTPERRGNYWSNWDGADWGTQNAYPIDGGMASDWYPLPATGMHLPIHITSNHEFTPLNGVVGGLGTEDEPYIIEGWEVDGDGGGYCIWVENTDVYFVIRNCKLYNATEQLAPPGGVGIALNSVKNGKIEKNLCTQSIIGIRLYGSSQHNTLVGNIGIGNTQKGLELYSSTNNTINDNQFSSNSYGVYLSSSSNNTLTKIKATNNSYGIYLSSSSTNILSSNYVCSNNIGFYLTSSSSIYIANNNVSFNSFGLYLAFSNNNEILYNWICSNTNYGVYLTSSTGNNIHHNNFIGNRESITASLKGVSGMCQAYDN
ncbi:MAG: NosD domain-containing protein, partial [Thermoplasmata archaeon]